MYQDYQGLCPDERELLSQVFREIGTKGPVEFNSPPNHRSLRTVPFSREEYHFVSAKAQKDSHMCQNPASSKAAAKAGLVNPG